MRRQGPLRYGRARSLPNDQRRFFDRCRFQPLGIAFAGNRSVEKRPRYFRSGKRFLGGRRFVHLSVDQFLHGCGLNGTENLYSRGVEMCGHDANPIDEIIMHFSGFSALTYGSRARWEVALSSGAVVRQCRVWATMKSGSVLERELIARALFKPHLFRQREPLKSGRSMHRLLALHESQCV